MAKGTTTVIDMATPNKGGSLKDCLATWNQLAEGKSSCDYTYHMSMIEWKPTIVAEIQEMIAQVLLPSKCIWLMITYGPQMRKFLKR